MSKPSISKHKTSHDVFKTICNVCNKPCEVPFKPNGKKPVFCDTCFSKTKTPATSFSKRKEKTVFDTPDNVIIPTYTGQSTSSTDMRIVELKRELSSANAKLDKLIDLFSKLK